jgi:hypothetical protein
MIALRYASEFVTGPFPCFVCARVMTWDPAQEAWSCAGCEVTEVRTRKYVNRTRLLASARDPVTGEKIWFIDHAAGHHPSPA